MTKHMAPLRGKGSSGLDAGLSAAARLADIALVEV